MLEWIEQPRIEKVVTNVVCDKCGKEWPVKLNEHYDYNYNEISIVADGGIYLGEFCETCSKRVVQLLEEEYGITLRKEQW